MSFRVANSGETIPAKFDGALRSTYANNQDYIVDGVGDEFAMTYNASSLQVTVGTGVANISGRGISAEASNSITLTASTTTYLCLRIDLSQTAHNEGMLYANTSSTIASDNLSNTNGQHDLLLAIVVTDASGVTSLTDKRTIKSQASVEYTLPTASSSTLGGVKVGTNLSISNGVLSSTNTTYSAGTGINLSGTTFSQKFAGVDVSNVLYSNTYSGDQQWTATADCYCYCSSNDAANIQINSVVVSLINDYSGNLVKVKSGQVVSIHNVNYAYSTTIKAFGVKY